MSPPPENAERALLAERILAEQDERRRLAELIHDGPVQHLSAITQMLDAALEAVRTGEHERAGGDPRARAEPRTRSGSGPAVALRGPRAACVARARLRSGGRGARSPRGGAGGRSRSRSTSTMATSSASTPRPASSRSSATRSTRRFAGEHSPASRSRYVPVDGGGAELVDLRRRPARATKCGARGACRARGDAQRQVRLRSRPLATRLRDSHRASPVCGTSARIGPWTGTGRAGYLLFVWSAAGLHARRAVGRAARRSARRSRTASARFRVTKIAVSPLPGDTRACAYLLPS